MNMDIKTFCGIVIWNHFAGGDIRIFVHTLSSFQVLMLILLYKPQ